MTDEGRDRMTPAHRDGISNGKGGVLADTEHTFGGAI